MILKDIKATQVDTLKQFIKNNGISTDVLLEVIVASNPVIDTVRPTNIAMASYKAQVWAWHKEGITQTEIAKRTGRQQSAISNLLKAMYARDYGRDE